MKMKPTSKDFYMEIRKSPGRFLSILFIVALGVAFFSGIQASSPDMRLSGDDYYNEDSPEKNVAEVIIAKQRAGSTGTVKLAWIGNYTKFANLERYRD